MIPKIWWLNLHQANGYLKDTYNKLIWFEKPGGQILTMIFLLLLFLFPHWMVFEIASQELLGVTNCRMFFFIYWRSV